MSCHKFETVNTIVNAHLQIPFILLSSKALLIGYLESRSVTNVVGIGGSENILKFLRTNVFPHEDHFAAQKYHFTFSFNEYSNTCLEGTNNGLKFNSNAVLPSMGLAKAGKCMINQDESKALIRKRKSSAAFNNVPLYTITKTSHHLNEVAEGMMKEQIALSENYSSVRVSETLWHVCSSGEIKHSEDSDSEMSPIPIFKRTRIVSANSNGGLQCSCGYANRNGVPDRHIIHVAMNYGINFEGFNHHNVHVRFWRAFDKFVAVGEPTKMDSAELKIRSKLWQARFSPTLIISVPGGFLPFQPNTQFSIGNNSNEMFRGMSRIDAFEHFSNRVEMKVSNYTTNMVDMAVAALIEKSSVHTVGLSQEMYSADDDGGDEDVLDFDEQNERSFLAWQCTGNSINNSHQILYPRVKELASIYENNPERLQEIAAVLDELIKKGKAENAVTKQKPAGQMISAIPRNGNVKQRKHSKQIQRK